MAKPTDGPWTYESTNAGHFWVLPAEGARLVIAEVYDEANARLIAKARHLPELIAVLKIVRPMVEDYADYHESFGILNQLDAALALVQETE